MFLILAYLLCNDFTSNIISIYVHCEVQTFSKRKQIYPRGKSPTTTSMRMMWAQHRSCMRSTGHILWGSAGAASNHISTNKHSSWCSTQSYIYKQTFILVQHPIIYLQTNIHPGAAPNHISTNKHSSVASASVKYEYKMCTGNFWDSVCLIICHF